ncbi:MAG: KamA family radical SAM protein [Proteobacteria bacterium]|nr:KamA family radical SAM protein [Pseudomonadota bacterium]
MNRTNDHRQDTTRTDKTLPISPEIDAFRRRFFPETDRENWNSWKWQLQNRIKSPEQLNRFFEATNSERSAVARRDQKLPLAITPYYAAVVGLNSQAGELRKTVVPTGNEFVVGSEESSDPLIEDHYSPLPNIIHRYPDRVLFLSTRNCAVYCRYCTRARLVGKAERKISAKYWKQGLEYIEARKEVREVIVSGGDALFLDDSSLETLLRGLRDIPHVEIVRLGTKIPMVLPQRVTNRLAAMLKQYHPIFISLHIVHPDELTPEAKFALDVLVDSGVVVGSQTVLLKGVNDDLDVMRTLMETLLRFRVRPYALYQCDPIQGSRHFRTPLQKGLDLIEGLRKTSSGYAVPQYIADPPGGKVSLAPYTVISKNNEGYFLKNWRGDKVFYPDPPDL